MSLRKLKVYVLTLCCASVLLLPGANAGPGFSGGNESFNLTSSRLGYYFRGLAHSELSIEERSDVYRYQLQRYSVRIRKRQGALPEPCTGGGDWNPHLKCVEETPERIRGFFVFFEGWVFEVEFVSDGADARVLEQAFQRFSATFRAFDTRIQSPENK